MKNGRFLIVVFLTTVVFIAAFNISRSWGLRAQAEAARIRASQHVYVQEEAEKADIRVERARIAKNLFLALSIISASGGGVYVTSYLIRYNIESKRQKTQAEKEAELPSVIQLRHGLNLIVANGTTLIMCEITGVVLPLREANKVMNERVALMSKVMPLEVVAKLLATVEVDDATVQSFVHRQLGENSSKKSFQSKAQNIYN